MNQMEIIPLVAPVKKTVTIPGSKSYTNRALVLAALTKRNVIIKNPLQSDDTIAMIECLEALGILLRKKSDAIEVVGSIADVKEKTCDLDTDLSGTTMRFLLAVCCIIPGIKILHGKEGLNKRPIRDLVDALRQLGANISYLAKEGHPPVKISSSTLTAKNVVINGSVSSQFLSGLLMIAPLIGNMIITIEGKPVSKPYIDMTLDILQTFGAHVQNYIYQTYIIEKKQTYLLPEYTVEGDFSSAGYFLAIAALTKSAITLQNINPNSKQADKKLLDVLEKMGSTYVTKNQQMTIKKTCLF